MKDTTSIITINNIMKTTIITVICLLGSALLAAADIQTAHIQPTETTAILARECELGKTIVLRLHIASDGTVAEADPHELDPYDALLAERVMQSVKQWKFTPATHSDGTPCEIQVLLPIHIQSIEKT